MIDNKIRERIKQIEEDSSLTSKQQQVMVFLLEDVLNVYNNRPIDGVKTIHYILNQIPKDLKSNIRLEMFDICHEILITYQRAMFVNYLKVVALCMPFFLFTMFLIFNRHDIHNFGTHFRRFLHYRWFAISSAYERFEKPFLAKHKILA